MADETPVTDQAAQQSVTDRVAGKFGFPGNGAEAAPDVQAGEGEIQAEMPEFAEIEWGGETFQIPGKLKDAFMKNQDYTQKTQALSVERQSVDHLKSLTQQAQVDRVFFDSVSTEQQEISVIDAYLQQVQKLDWSQMNTDQMMRQKMEVDSIKERRAEIQRAVGDKRAKFDTEVKAKIAELRKNSRDLAAKSITGFSEDTEKGLRAYAASEGLTEGEIDSVLMDPRSFKVMWKAMQFEKVQANTGRSQQAVARTLKPGASHERMPANTASKLNFAKAMGQAKTSGEKASVIEQRLTGIFSQGHK